MPRGRRGVDSVCVVVLLIAGFMVAACANEGSLYSPAVVVAQARDPLSLDPALATSSEAAQIVSQIFEPLVRRANPSRGVKPCLATRWQVSKDGLRWLFHLRRGVHFHDGTVFDADAVVFSFERQRDLAHPFFRKGFAYGKTTFGHIVRTRKIERFTVEIQTRRPFAPFLATLATYPVGIVNPREFRLRGDKARPIGTGPYRFVRWRRGDRIVLARNVGYWGGTPKVKRLVFAVIPGAQQRLNGLESGTVDMIFGLQPKLRPLVQLHPDLRLLSAGAPNIAYLAMNTRRPPFDDIRVRRAVNYAIDKRLIVKLGYEGLARSADGPLPAEMWSHLGGAPRYSYNPGRARRLLREAGFPKGQGFILRVMTTPRPYLPSPKLVARIIARNLLQVGIRVEIVARPHAEHVAALHKGAFDLGILGWVTDNGDPDNFLYVLLDRDNIASGQNVAFFNDLRVHRLLTSARQEMRRRAREILYQTAQKIIADEAPWVPLAHATMLVALRRRLVDVRVAPTNTLDLRGMDVR